MKKLTTRHHTWRYGCMGICRAKIKIIIQIHQKDGVKIINKQQKHMINISMNS